MSEQQRDSLADLVEGIVIGRLLDAGVDRKLAARVAHNAGAYAKGQVKEVVRA